MSTAASLSLLKGGKKTAVEEELETAPEAEAPAEEAEAASEGDEEEVTVDVDKMSAKEIDALVAEHEIAVPENWSKMKVAEKRTWLKEQFEEVEEEEAEPDTPAEPEQAEEPAEEPAPEPAPEEPAPEKAKLPAKKKAPAKQAKQDIEVPGEDALSDLVHEIETLKEDEARHMVSTLSNETDMTLFKLGGVLSLIQANGWFTPYASFREYVEKEVGLHYRKATYWCAIYNHLAESKVPWEKVKSIGWTKLKEIAELLTIDNVDEWAAIAKSQTTLQLIETVKASKQKDSPKALEDQASKTVTTITFKVHEDQKETVKAAIAKAKDDSGTTVDTAALEFICLDFLGGQSMSDRLKKMGLEAALEALEKAFPNTNISVELTEE